MIPIHIYPSKETPGTLAFDANRDSPRLMQVPAPIRVRFLTPKDGERTALIEKAELLPLTRDPRSEATQAKLRKLYDPTA